MSLATRLTFSCRELGDRRPFDNVLYTFMTAPSVAVCGEKLTGNTLRGANSLHPKVKRTQLVVYLTREMIPRHWNFPRINEDVCNSSVYRRAHQLTLLFHVICICGFHFWLVACVSLDRPHKKSSASISFGTFVEQFAQEMFCVCFALMWLCCSWVVP